VNREREKIIVDYVSTHQGCTAQDIVNGVIDKISRIPVFNIISQLVNDGVLRDDKINRRDHRYFVVENNLLVTVPKDLDEFARNFYYILDKVQDSLEDNDLARKRAVRFGWSRKSTTPENLHQMSEVAKHVLMDPAVDVFFAQVIVYNLHALSVWPSVIKDSKVLSQLYSIVFSKFNEIRNFLLQRYRELFPENLSYLENYKPPLSTNELRFNFIGWKTELIDVMNLDVKKEFYSIKNQLEGIAFFRGEHF
jgi:hypothetical protein